MKKVDQKQKPRDNSSVILHHDNAQIEGKQLKINKEDLVPLNDPKCKHEYELDDSENEPAFYGIKCKKCILGKLIKKDARGIKFYKELGGRTP
jgi:hypothetical protein